MKPSGEPQAIKLDEDYKAFSQVRFSPDGKCAYLVAGSPTIFSRLIKVDVNSGTTTVVRKSHADVVDPEYYSNPMEVSWDTTYDDKAYGYYYPPQVHFPFLFFFCVR